MLECDIYIGREILWPPILPIRFRDESRDLAEDVWSLRQLSNSFRPGCDVMSFDVRLAKMIQHETLAFEPPHELRRDGQVPRIDQNVVRKVELFQHGNSA